MRCAFTQIQLLVHIYLYITTFCFGEKLNCSLSVYTFGGWVAWSFGAEALLFTLQLPEKDQALWLSQQWFEEKIVECSRSACDFKGKQYHVNYPRFVPIIKRRTSAEETTQQLATLAPDDMIKKSLMLFSVRHDQTFVSPPDFVTHLFSCPSFLV